MVDVTIVTQLEGALSVDWTNSMFMNMVAETEYKQTRAWWFYLRKSITQI